MMDGMKKVRPGQSALFLLGIIYPIVGGVFLMVGLAFWLAGTDEELTLLGMIFTGIGGLFLLLGVIFLSVELSRLRRNNRLLSAGRYVWGQIVQVVCAFAADTRKSQWCVTVTAGAWIIFSKVKV